MKSGKYTLRELWADGDAEQFVVPELQRDYVWTKKQIEPLLNNLFEAYQRYREFKLPEFPGLQEEQIRELGKIYRDNNCSCNIGFIYAYYDTDVSGRHFLIDGQQRMTTIYLLMAYLAYQNKSDRNKFISRYFRSLDINSKIDDFRNYKLKLDYRVRDVAHEFLQHLIYDMTRESPQSYLKDSLFNNQKWETEEYISSTLQKIPWYHLYYRDDVSVRSFVRNLHSIHQIVKDKDDNLSGCFSYLEDYVEFWYFDTNQSSQGEELYIYMNSRGEQLSYNENRRPDFLSSAKEMKEKEEHGKIWDNIQNFFWKNRGDNPSADKGFNFFLRLVELLNITEQQPWSVDKTRYATDERVQSQLKDFINKTNSDNISVELEKYYSASKTEEKWNDLIAYSKTFCAFAKISKEHFPFPINSYLQGVIPEKTQREFLVFIALLIVFKGQDSIDVALLRRCRLYFENLMRQEEVENEPTSGSRALFELARYVGEKQDLYSLQDVENKLLSFEEQNKLRYLAGLDIATADEQLEFLDSVLRDNTLLKGKIYLLLYVVQDVIDNNPFAILKTKEFQDKVLELKSRLKAVFKSEDKELYNTVSFGNYFRYRSVQRTTYPYIYDNDESNWYHTFYNYNNKEKTEKPNPFIVQFIKNDFKSKEAFVSFEHASWNWLQKLFASKETRCIILQAAGKAHFGEFNKKIYFHGGYPLFGKVSLFADRTQYVKDDVTKILTMDYDDKDFILKIDSEEERRISIQKEGQWNFEELNECVRNFTEKGEF